MIPSAKRKKHQVRLITHCQECSSFVSHLPIVSLHMCLWDEEQDDDDDVEKGNSWVLIISHTVRINKETKKMDTCTTHLKIAGLF